MDTSTRRVTAIALVLAIAATVYAVDSEIVKFVIWAVLSIPCLIWGFWPRGPRIKLLRFFVKRVPWFNARGTLVCETDVISAVFLNDPKGHSEIGVARGLKVTFTCVGGEISLPWIDARSDYSPQPPSLPPDKLPDLEFDLGIDKWREVSFVVKEPNSRDCYLFNNDSYNFSRIQNPDWKIGPGDYKLLVKMSGIGVRNRRFECSFTNPGANANLVVKSFLSIPTRGPQAGHAQSKASE